MDIILNIFVISLLLVTTIFCWRLNKKIIELKDSKKDLGELVKTFDTAIIKTHRSIADLKVMSQNSSAELYQYVEKAGELISDLSFMTDSAARLADRLEKAITVARQEIIVTSKDDNNFSKKNIDEVISKIPSKVIASDSNFSLSDTYISKSKEELIKTIKLIKSG